MFRNKENIPLGTADRQNGPSRSSSKHLASDEFFTDSLLDATRLSSRIPSPSPQKQPLAKARRARNLRSTRNAQPLSHRSSTTENSATHPRQKSLQPSTPQRSGHDPARLRTNSLSTPPGSNGELPLPSPYSSISSPPPQDLTDTYRQIEDEDDLAQTERELSSDDGNGSGAEQVQPFRLNQRSKSESPYKVPATLALSSAASTPTRSFSGVKRHRRLNDRTETLSEASGLSFLKEITDQGLAEKLTPHVSGIARDKARLREMWEQKPIAFSKATIPPRFDPRPGPSNLASRSTAFSQASKPLPNSIFHNGHGTDPMDRPMSQHSGAESQRSSNDTRGSDERAHVLPINTRTDRKFKFSNNHGFPTQRSALTEKNLEQQNRGAPNIEQPSPLLPSAPSLLSNRSSDNAKVLGESVHITNEHVSKIPRFRNSPQVEFKTISEERPQIDWAAVAADVPIASVETSLESSHIAATPAFLSKTVSPEKSRRWDNDFTGHSFQVSESPPVRSKPEVKSQDRHWEIEGIARQAVTTNRLSEIRERQSQESLRSISKSPAPRSTSQPPETKSSSALPAENESAYVAEPVPDTPVVIYRSSSNSGSDKTTLTPALERPSADRSKSHDHLQRLARAMSSTPRSSPASENKTKQIEEMDAPILSKVEEVSSMEKPQTFVASREPTNGRNTIAQTPRVVGAWTDTILPETVKTVKQNEPMKGYAQTPHISAGGWIDTPAPNQQRKFSGTVATILEEVPEDLTAGIVKDTAGSDTIKLETSVDNGTLALVPPQPQPQEQPKSALASILDQQKNRLVSQDITNATKEDTLNLGNDTLESLQDLLALDENDLTTISRLSVVDDDTKPLGEIQAESELIERLGIKLDRLRSNIHDARKGISKLEHQVSNPHESAVQITPQQLLGDTICATCNRHTLQPHLHPELTSKLLPHASLNLSLPIPLLFYPRKPTQWLPRPTPLGGIVLATWLWYLTENTMCELYCRPTHTDFYIWPSEPEPEFPFVLPTMLARWTRINDLGIESPVLWLWSIFASLVRAVTRIISMSLGWSDGFVGESAPMSARVVKSVVETVTSVAVNAAASAAGIDLSMNDDEYI